uniref:Cytochrome c biogenesis protein transmembrane region n=1 Tax=Asparagopsis taxiformis TaxID=260499 RepID=A0A1C9CC75_9FLOR|nr:cytochrome c biogenesis protein transmembrane region [Asparagopsis taxiformis]AOM65989.1 cytochrome c biogenesis protein transmembrane region [Asparagopsis taxiformis]
MHMLSLFNSLELYIYLVQQKIYLFISTESSSTNVIMTVIFFICGCLTSFSPCLVSMFPIVFSYVGSQNIGSFKKIIFFLGFASSLLCMIIFTIFFKQNYQLLRSSVPLLSSIIMILISLSLLNIIQFSFVIPDLQWLFMLTSNFSIQAYMMGFILGLSSSTCSTPVLISLTFWLNYSINLNIISYVLFYLMGSILPLSIFINAALYYHKFKRYIRLWNYVTPCSGSILLGFSILSFLNYALI